jgi:biotin synthase-like enzyme
MMGLIEKSNAVYHSNFGPEACFERAIFLSWYCSKGDCAFCYMSTQKGLIAEPKKARRSKASILAEAVISKACGWEVEFLSGGYDSFSESEIAEISKGVSEITGSRQWLNLGALKHKELEALMPYSQGYIGTLECANPVLREKLCPSKPLGEIVRTFKACDRLGLKKGATLIIGLGETLDDFPNLEAFIREHALSRITFYSLNPQKGTAFRKSPPIDYYEKWIAMARIAFPALHIVAGAWSDKTHYFSRLLKAGANNFTKFPALKKFGSSEARLVEAEVRAAGRLLSGTLTRLPSIPSHGPDVDRKLKQYLSKMI